MTESQFDIFVSLQNLQIQGIYMCLAALVVILLARFLGDIK